MGEELLHGLIFKAVFFEQLGLVDGHQFVDLRRKGLQMEIREAKVLIGLPWLRQGHGSNRVGTGLAGNSADHRRDPRAVAISHRRHNA